MGEGGTSWIFHTHAACFQLLPTLEGASGFVWYSTEPQPHKGQQLPAPIHLTQAHAPPPLSHMHTPQPTPCPSGDCVEPGVFWGGTAALTQQCSPALLAYFLHSSKFPSGNRTFHKCTFLLGRAIWELDLAQERTQWEKGQPPPPQKNCLQREGIKAPRLAFSPMCTARVCAPKTQPPGSRGVWLQVLPGKASGGKVRGDCWMHASRTSERDAGNIVTSLSKREINYCLKKKKKDIEP